MSNQLKMHLLKGVVLILLFLARGGLAAQVPYFNINFDYDNRLETAALTCVETDEHYLIPIKCAAPLASMADTPLVLSINKKNVQVEGIKIAYAEGQSLRNILKQKNNLLLHGTNYNGPKEAYVDNDQYLAQVHPTTFDTFRLRHFGLANRLDVFYRPIVTSDGGVFATGWSFPIAPTGRQSLLAFKCDSQLRQQFLKIWPPQTINNYYGAGAIETPDGGFLIVGTRQVGNPPEYNHALIVKMDALGNFVFQREIPHIGDTTELYLTDVAPNGNGTYIAVGRRVYNPRVGPGWERAWVIGFDGQGKVLWSNTYAENERSDWADIAPGPDGSFYVCGYQRDFADMAPYKQYATVAKLSKTGKLLWHRKYSAEPEGKHYDAFFNVLPTADGGILCSGTTYGNDTSLQNAWVVKLDSLGCAAPNCATTDSKEPIPVGSDMPFIIAPVPTVDHIRISAKPNHTIDRVQIFSLLGQSIFDNKPTQPCFEVGIDLQAYPNGSYLCCVMEANVAYIRNIIKR